MLLETMAGFSSNVLYQCRPQRCRLFASVDPSEDHSITLEYPLVTREYLRVIDKDTPLQNLLVIL